LDAAYKLPAGSETARVETTDEGSALTHRRTCSTSMALGDAHARLEDRLPVAVEPLARLTQANCLEHAFELLNL
jgi:hypothetical protein